MLSKIYQAGKGEVRIQMTQSAINWICGDEEWIEDRAKEIGCNSQDGASSTCISSAEIYRASKAPSLIPSTETFQKCESHYAAWQTRMRVDMESRDSKH